MTSSHENSHSRFPERHKLSLDSLIGMCNQLANSSEGFRCMQEDEYDDECQWTDLETSVVYHAGFHAMQDPESDASTIFFEADITAIAGLSHVPNEVLTTLSESEAKLLYVDNIDYIIYKQIANYFIGQSDIQWSVQRELDISFNPGVNAPNKLRRFDYVVEQSSNLKSIIETSDDYRYRTDEVMDLFIESEKQMHVENVFKILGAFNNRVPKYDLLSIIPIDLVIDNRAS